MALAVLYSRVSASGVPYDDPCSLQHLGLSGLGKTEESSSVNRHGFGGVASGESSYHTRYNSCSKEETTKLNVSVTID